MLVIFANFAEKAAVASQLCQFEKWRDFQLPVSTAATTFEKNGKRKTTKARIHKVWYFAVGTMKGVKVFVG